MVISRARVNGRWKKAVEVVRATNRLAKGQSRQALGKGKKAKARPLDGERTHEEQPAVGQPQANSFQKHFPGCTCDACYFHLQQANIAKLAKLNWLSDGSDNDSKHLKRLYQKKQEIC